MDSHSEEIRDPLIREFDEMLELPPFWFKRLGAFHLSVELDNEKFVPVILSGELPRLTRQRFDN